MDLSNLKAFEGSRKKKKRVGRGESSGLGKTCGRGTKGAQSRSGGGVRRGFEGGQMPLYRKVPKLRGFKALKGKDYEIVNISSFDKIEAPIIDIIELKKHGLVTNRAKKIKVLGVGDLSKKITLKTDYISKKAVEIIEKSGGKVEVING